MVRLHNRAQNRAKKIYDGADTPPSRPLPDGKVRCPSCGQVTSLTPRGHLRRHDDGAGVECPQRVWRGERDGPVPKAPPVVIPPMGSPPGSGAKPKPKPTKPGGPRMCQLCEERPVTGERRYCGRCAATRR